MNSPPCYLGLEIGGTKLQVGIGHNDGHLQALWRGQVDLAQGPAGIRRQIIAAIPQVLADAKLDRSHLRSAGIGFGGPVDDASRTVLKSHQIEGWDHFPLADWIADAIGLPVVLGNDADVAGLAEALHGAGKGYNPVFYITIGSGIGGGFILNGKIFRGLGKGAAEIGHLKIHNAGRLVTVESLASGWGMEQRYQHLSGSPDRLDVPAIFRRAEDSSLGDEFAHQVITEAREALALAIGQVIALLCPQRMVIGGGVSLLGEQRLFRPLRDAVDRLCFRPFAGLTEIVPASLAEEVVVHGAIALASQASP